MECKFVVGQRVVCVGDTGMDMRFGETGPKVDHVYTIRAVCASRHIGLQLEEIKNTPHKYYDGICECDFLVRRFRPAIDFQSLCDVKRERVS